MGDTGFEVQDFRTSGHFWFSTTFLTAFTSYCRSVNDCYFRWPKAFKRESSNLLSNRKWPKVLKSRTSNPVSPEPPGPRAQAPMRLWDEATKWRQLCQPIWAKTYSCLREMTGQNQPQLPEAVPYSEQRESTVGEEHVARRKFRYTIVLNSSQISIWLSEARRFFVMLAGRLFHQKGTQSSEKSSRRHTSYL